MQNKTSDIELIKQVLAGDQGSYAELVRRHQRFVFTLALRFTKNREDAEEVAQDCFVKAIVYTTSMTFLRKKKLDTDSIDSEGSQIQLENHVSDFRSDQVEQKSKYAYLTMAINQLLPDDAAIITLFYKGEQSLEEVAKAMGMESNTVKVKLHRARHRLKEKLEALLHHEVKELL
jgi:RNA polymerase sigma factor (sigma-70 family)